MSTPQFVVADLGTDRSRLVGINVEYVAWVCGELQRMFGITPEELVGMPVADYVPSVIDKVCGQAPPLGTFYLLMAGDALAGMGGLRHLRAGMAEVKRVYVRPAFRGKGLGEAMLNRLLDDARTFGYRSICLDSAPFMKAAQRVYEAAGFKDCAAYEGSEVPVSMHRHWRFMERPL